MPKIHYEKSQREYTVVGITAVIDAFLQKPFTDFYGAALTEISCVIQNGTFFHYRVIGDRERVSRSVLQKINEDEFDLEQEYRQFDQAAATYEQLIYQDASTFSLQTILDFYAYYMKLLPVAYLGMDPIDQIEYLDSDKHAMFTSVATNIRRRGEFIYKDGEMKFIPRYLVWLCETHLPSYTPDLLRYLLFTEMQAFAKQTGELPSPEQLAERKKLLYICQQPLRPIVWATGEKARQVIDEKELLKQPTDRYDVDELKGQIAFSGTARGRARIIRSRADMAGFEDGDIIVSPMTDPNYLPIMKRAAAFVTNEGGMLCHAAIVARELNKPCIIGTKMATHVFRDGEWIEVDALEGVVRKV